jgi:hypothetical protein
VLAPAGRGEERKCRRQQKPGKLRKRQNSWIYNIINLN